jgi:glycosyltransferase involved in cell wall biosynthesis
MGEDTAELSAAAAETASPGAAGAPADSGAPIKVFVHLARNKDAEEWRAAKRSGKLVGFNDETPYGYGLAEAMGCRIAYSRSDRERLLGKLARFAVRAATGFDLVHAWRQRRAMADADIVWTHTESQYLAVSAVLLMTRTRPKLLGQTVWLMDHWASFNPLRRALYRKLIRRVDVLTFHSPANLAIAAALFPDKKTVLVRYGIATDIRVAPRERPATQIHVLAIGNDRDRDWPTLIAAVRDQPNMSLLILSGAVSPRLARGAQNVEIRRARTQAELMQGFGEATLVCVPLRPNVHASGITVIQEAALAGVPIVATDAGGLDAYFPHDEVRYAPAGDVEALRRALRTTASDPVEACAQARRAQQRMVDGRLGAEAYIRAHVELSREVLSR